MREPITIIGGGLAGLSLGIALRKRSLPVVIHEASTYPRHRVCGEFISGVSDETLRALGISEALADAECLTTAKWHDAATCLGTLKVTARGISRWRLDLRLRDQFLEAGGILKTHSRTTQSGDVVWAAGRPKQPSKWVGLKCHFSNLPLGSDLEMHTGGNGYLGLARIEGARVNVCGLFAAQSLAQIRDKGAGRLVQMLRHGGLHTLADRLEAADPDEESFCGVAGFGFGRQKSVGFALGDAACMIPPFTGNGMTMAFEAAECAIAPLEDFAAGRTTFAEASEQARRAQTQRFQRRVAMAGMIHPLLTSRWGMFLATGLARQRLVPYAWLLRLVR